MSLDTSIGSTSATIERLELARNDTGSVADAISPFETSRSVIERRSFKYTWRLIASDFRFRCTYEHKPPSTKTYIKLLRHPGMSSVVQYRLQHYFYARGWRMIGGLLKYLNIVLYGVEINENARIGPGLLIVHANTIIIGSDVIIGERCVLFHQNAITNSPFFEPGEDWGPVIIGDDVVFGGGAVAYGKIVIGDRTTIGTNSVVNKSFPGGSSLFGVPARVVGKRSEA
jgi:serine O-acetyltransferase